MKNKAGFKNGCEDSQLQSIPVEVCSARLPQSFKKSCPEAHLPASAPYLPMTLLTTICEVQQLSHARDSF